jgi:hypothetical protein
MLSHGHLGNNLTKSFMHSVEDAQAVVNAYHAGRTTVIKVVNENEVIVRYDNVTGVFSAKNGTITGSSNIFTIKGKNTVTVHPENPISYGN